MTFFLPVTPLEQVAMISVVLLVIIVELLNSAVEAVVDRFGSEWNELIGRAKDIGSAAVFVALLVAWLVWTGILFLSHIPHKERALFKRSVLCGLL
jgi:diacylglycerol kinase (ATP)